MVVSSAVHTFILVAGQRVRAVGVDAEHSNGVSLGAFEFGEAEGGVSERVDELAELGGVLVHIKYYEYRRCFKNK